MALASMWDARHGEQESDALQREVELMTASRDYAMNECVRAGVDNDALRRENEQLRRDICRAIDLLWSAVEWMSADGCDCGVGEPGTCTLCMVHEFVETKAAQAGKEGAE